MTLLLDGWWERHEWWAVSLRKLAESSTEATAAIEHLVGLLMEGPDCQGCIDGWLDESLGNGPRYSGDDDFPAQLSTDDVAVIMRLETPELIAHELARWLAIRKALADGQLPAPVGIGDPPATLDDAAMVPADGVQELRAQDREVRPADPA